ncbi:hypothetical protein SAMN05421890_1275 [Ensifer adhaerens]|nr:hypothetical protein SAMN05421890_1275 [Ensifer adhaerens]
MTDADYSLRSLQELSKDQLVKLAYSRGKTIIDLVAAENDFNEKIAANDLQPSDFETLSQRKNDIMMKLCVAEEGIISGASLRPAN